MSMLHNLKITRVAITDLEKTRIVFQSMEKIFRLQQIGKKMDARLLEYKDKPKKVMTRIV
jgi:hypothetical protein